MSLKEQREKCGLTHMQLSKKSGVHYIRIIQYESGKCKVENMTVRNALALSAALGCQVKDLL